MDGSLLILGSTGLIGSACKKLFPFFGYSLLTPTHEELDLEVESAVESYFAKNKPAIVILAAGKVGGIVVNNTFPGDFIEKNLKIQSNVLSMSRKMGVTKTVFLGSSCMYPKECAQPMRIADLHSGRLEPTSQAYAVAKLAGIEQCLAYNKQEGKLRFIPAIPNSAYGPCDDFSPESSHVLSALIRKFHEAKKNNQEKVVLWGSGRPRREFVFSKDIAEAIAFLLHYDLSKTELPINVGCGYDTSIEELAKLVQDVVGFEGEVIWDSTKPDGTFQKLLDSRTLRDMGWFPKIDLRTGIETTYQWFLDEECEN